MPGDVLVGSVLTGIFLVIFLLWTWHELRRVDEVADPPPDEPQV